MEDLRVFRHFLVMFGTVAVIFLMIAYFSQGWLKYDLRIVTEERTVCVAISRGLWSTSGCVVLNFTEFTHDACGTISEKNMDTFIENSDLVSEAKDSVKSLFDNFMKLRILLMFGGIHGIVGLIFSLFLHKGRNFLLKPRGYCCVYSWAASATLVMTAVILQNRKETSFNREIDALNITDDAKEQIKLPYTLSWVMHVSGTGSVIGAFMAMVLLVKLCRGQKQGRNTINYSGTSDTLRSNGSDTEDEFDQSENEEFNLGYTETEADGYGEISFVERKHPRSKVNRNGLDIYM